MKLFRFRGGVHPADNKQRTADKPIVSLPLPQRLYVPVQQHIGAPADPVVKVGDKVLKGQLLAHSQGAISAPVHAPSSGTVVAIESFTAPHPSGLPVRTIILETDGEDRWVDTETVSDPFALEPEEIAVRVGAAGIVGMGGATFPAAVKLNLGKSHSIHTLVINGGECEPYLTCDDRLMRERAEAIVDGIRIIRHALGAKRALIAIEDNKPEALASMQAACEGFGEVAAVKVPTHYPMGSEKQMIQALTGLEVPAGKRSADIGVIVHNVGTAYAVHLSLRAGRPLVSRIVTVGGGAVRQPANLEVPIGTLASDLLKFCGEYAEEPARLLSGGPMMGQLLPHTRVPIIKGTNGIIALTQRELHAGSSKPCIRCGRCVAACPCGLVPLEMAAHARKDDLEGAIDYGLLDCIACGSCSYVCPSNIPLVHYFNYAKGQLAYNQAEQRKNDEIRRLTQLRSTRLEKEEQAKAARKKPAKAAASGDETPQTSAKAEAGADA